MERQLELLAPAGNLKTFKAVISAGADAVYFGGIQFGARAYAGNFNQDEVLEAIDYGHIHDKKAILAVNTLLKNDEIENKLYEYLLPYYERGLDAVILQDFGVMQFVRQNFPGLSIHTSTQMTVTSKEGAAFLAKQGADRVVMARELSCEEIAKIHCQVPVELESFVHGALCYSYSGACLFSSMLGGRSGNRGRCAQPCRLPYEVYGQQGQKLQQKGLFPLSAKDLCTILELPKLAECGIYSFKIEGRMKQIEYAAGVVSVYRHYMDQYLSLGTNGYSVNETHIQKLLDFGNRSGFTKGCYHQWNGPDMITFEKPSHKRSTSPSQTQGEAPLHDVEIQEKINGFLRIKKDLPAKLTVLWGDITVEAEGSVPLPAQKQPLTKEGLAAKIEKTGNTPFYFETLEIDCEEGLFLPVQKINELRRTALDGLLKRKREDYFRNSGEMGLEKQLHFPTDENPCPVPYDKSRMCVSASIEEIQQLEILLNEPGISRIYLDSNLFTKNTMQKNMQDLCLKIRNHGKEAYFILPAIFRYKTSQFYSALPELLEFDGYLAKSYDGLGFLFEKGVPPSKIVLDHSVYTYSDWSKNAFFQMGIAMDTVPLELNKREINHRNLRNSEMVVYGYLPLMTSVHCIQKNISGCDKIPKLHFLKDRYGVDFPVKNHCNECYNIIYNSKPLCLFGVLEEIVVSDIASLRLSFTTESPARVKQITALCMDSILQPKKIQVSDCIDDFTYGHYKRGVE